MADTESQNCEFCGHWHLLTTAIGECRAKSPTITISIQTEEATISNKGVWPKTFRHEWCSDFRKQVENASAAKV